MVIMMSAENENDHDGFFEVAELNESDDEESCQLWRLKNEHEYEQYRLELNTRSVLEAEAKIKLFVDTEITSPEKIAACSLDPVIRSAITQQEYTATFTADLPTMVKKLRERCNKSVNLEKTLISQASTLDAIFNSLATQAACVGLRTNTDKAEKLLRLAFKAQAQCAKTLQVALMAQEIAKTARNELIVNENGVNHGAKKMVEGTACLAVESDTASPALACINGRKVL
jgi:predicted Rdx family selenoprotein